MYIDDNRIWRPFTQMQNASEHFKVVKAKDSIITLDSGKDVIDAISSWWVITHGHCNDKIARSISQQAKTIDQVLFANFGHNPAENLSKAITKRLPSKLNNLFFSDNGSTAVEVALKMTIQYWINLGEKQRNLFLAFNNSYHGDTVGAMSVSGDSLFTSPYKELLFKVLNIKQGVHSFDSLDKYTNPFCDALEQYKDRLAGVIIEPLIQGAGGMIVWPKEAIEIIGRVAQKAKIPLIFDEVMTGFGRTGSLFAFDQTSIIPDLICLSKGLTGGALPLSLTVASNDIYKSFLSEEKSKMFFHGHSFTGNPISCAAANASLELFDEIDYETKWKKINKINNDRLRNIVNKSNIIDTRTCGTMAAIELTDPQSGYQSNLAESLTYFALERDVFLRPLGNIVYILPPYCISDSQLHQVWDVIEQFILLNDKSRS